MFADRGQRNPSSRHHGGSPDPVENDSGLRPSGSRTFRRIIRLPVGVSFLKRGQRGGI